MIFSNVDLNRIGGIEAYLERNLLKQHIADN